VEPSEESAGEGVSGCVELVGAIVPTNPSELYNPRRRIAVNECEEPVVNAPATLTQDSPCSYTV
jgi:hypothetical protein